MMTRAELKERAKASLSGNWGTVISVLVVEYLILAVLGHFLTIHLTPDQYYYLDDGTTITITGTTLDVASLLLQAPLGVGVAGVFLKLIRGEKAEIMDLFDGFKLCFIAALVASVVSGVLIQVGMLLLVVPGVILSLGLSQTTYILRDQPELNGIDAMKASWAMMRGHKAELFGLTLSFFPWYLACVVVIPAFYVVPYVSATMAAYYENLRGALYTNAEYDNF